MMEKKASNRLKTLVLLASLLGLIFIGSTVYALDNPNQSMRLPLGPEGPGKFGAYYTKLEYYPEWDQHWLVGSHPDIVVRFDDGGHRFVLWRGTNYIPHWVTNNSIWFTNSFVETWKRGVAGSFEPMSDKQNRYSHVRIIENHDARVVVHWRYALNDVDYRIASPNPETDWGDWVDEYYIIYPDAIGVRKVTSHSSLWKEETGRTTDDAGHEWQEGIVVYHKGDRPEKSLEIDAVHVANMQGEVGIWSWETPGEPTTPTPGGSNIVLMNVKSSMKPFTISPEGCNLAPYEGSQGGSHFRWRDHWPTTLEPTPGRNASGKQAAHGSFYHLRAIPVFDRGENWMSKIMLHGMTNKSVGDLATLAKSWLHAPQMALMGNSAVQCTDLGYDWSQRAYVIKCKQSSAPLTLEIEIDASSNSPLTNPAFVIEEWGRRGINLQINGERAERGSGYQYGHNPTENGYNLVVWIKAESVEPIRLTILPTSGKSTY